TRIVTSSSRRNGVQAPRVEAAAQVPAGLDGRFESHPLVQVDELAGRLSGDDAVDHALMIREPRLLLLEDPAAWLGAEQVAAAIQLQGARRVPPGPDEQRGELAEVAERGEPVGQRVGLAAGLPAPLELVPQRPAGLLPPGVLLVQPLALGA